MNESQALHEIKMVLKAKSQNLSHRHSYLYTETDYYVQGVIDCSDEVVKQIERFEESGEMDEWRKL